MKFPPPIPSCSNENICFHVGDYSFGFNGKDKESEFNSGAYDFGARIHDARLGRWMSVDKKFAKYPGMSPFNYSANIPTILSDIDGEDFRLKIVANESGSGGTITIQSTIFIYGPNASQNLADDANKSFKSKNSVSTYIDSEGASWKVTMDLVYVYSPLMDGEGTKDESDLRGTMNVLDIEEYNMGDACGPSLLNAIGYESGDNFQCVDASLPHGDTFQGLTRIGTINGTSYAPAGAIVVHESLHNIGYLNDFRFSSGIMGISLGNITKSMYFVIGKMVENKFFIPSPGSTSVETRKNYIFQDGVDAKGNKQLFDEQKERKNPEVNLQTDDEK